jgi:glycyl-tRNA synthetase
MAAESALMDKIVALCKRRGFIFQSSEIYGGIGGFWDYGPLGTELKRNVREAWWRDMIQFPPPGPDGEDLQMVGVDCSIIMNPKVWEASGHVGGFKDPMQSCRQCRRLFRADQVWDQLKSSEWLASFAEACGPGPSGLISVEGAKLLQWAKTKGKKKAPGLALVRNPEVTLSWFAQHLQENPGVTLDIIKLIQFVATEQYAQTGLQTPCPECGGELTEPRDFNLMFESHAGAVRDDAAKVYLRPETAQGIFVNFKNVMDSTRVKIPFGIGQIGKSFRNEINPRNFTFRSREFEQMEIEFFCHPSESMKWYEYWRSLRLKWYESLGIRSEKLRPRQQGEKELAHYSKACTDIEYLFPFADEPQELEGVAHRGCFDLAQHGKFSRGNEEAFAVVDDETKERFVPHVIEPSAGVDRFTLAVITEAYTFDESRASPEFMKFHPRLAPTKAAVFPLVAKDGLPEIGQPIYRELRKHYPCQYDAKQSIGKRYARMDEAGTPFCFTIDGQTKEDGTVTVRNRDDASQIRIDKSRCLEYLREQLRI